MRIYQNTECKILRKSYVAKNRKKGFDQSKIIAVYKNVKTAHYCVINWPNDMTAKVTFVVSSSPYILIILLLISRAFSNSPPSLAGLGESSPV